MYKMPKKGESEMNAPLTRPVMPPGSMGSGMPKKNKSEMDAPLTRPVMGTKPGGRAMPRQPKMAKGQGGPSTNKISQRFSTVKARMDAIRRMRGSK
jgi:hypothetical protein